MNSRTSRNKNRRKRRLIRFFALLSILLVFLALLTTLGWFVFHGIAKAADAGNDPPATQTTAATETTTTAKPTLPTIAVTGQISSPYVLLYDVTHSSLLYSKDSYAQCFPASLTKLLTAALAAEYCTPDEVFTVGTELSLVDPESSRANLAAGYQLTRDMILDALLLPSGNDAAYTIAAHVGRKISNNPDLGDYDAIHAFIDLMNQTLQEIGAMNSHFSDPDGIHSPDHYTCAADMLLIAQNAMKYDIIRTTVAKSTAHDKLLSGQNMTWTNTNDLINPSSKFYYQGVTGMKTGSTDQAGNCVVASAERNGVELIAVVMGNQSSDARWMDSEDLFNEAFAMEASLDNGITANP